VPTSVAFFLGLLALTVVERLVEVAVSIRNRRWAMERGGREVGQGHYPAMVVLHTAFLVGCAMEVLLLQPPFYPLLGSAMFLLAVLCQAGRWWCIATLGKRWNTRVIVIPGLAPVRTGPYRWFAHPNYVVVVLEGIALPLIHSACWTALLFTVLNFLLLRKRIQIENQALSGAVQGECRER